MSSDKTMFSGMIPQDEPLDASQSQVLTDDDREMRRSLVERLRTLQQVLLDMNGGKEYPDSTPLIREMRDNPRRI